MTNRRHTAAFLARGRQLSAELYQYAIRSVLRTAEACDEDAGATIQAMAKRYIELMVAAEEAARNECAPRLLKLGGPDYRRATHPTSSGI